MDYQLNLVPATANAVPYGMLRYRGFRSHRWRSLHTTAKFLLALTRFRVYRQLRDLIVAYKRLRMVSPCRR